MSGAVGEHQVGVLVRPVLGKPVDANDVRGNDNTIGKQLNAHDSDATIHVQSSTLAARPAFGTAGRFWITTDGTPGLWLDTGSAWVALGGSSGGGNSVTTTVAFGASFTDKAQTVVTGQAWVTTSSEIVAQIKTPSGTDPDEMRLLGMRVEVSDLVAATGFTVTAYSEAEARGDYDIMCVGV